MTPGTRRTYSPNFWKRRGRAFCKNVLGSTPSTVGIRALATAPTVPKVASNPRSMVVPAFAIIVSCGRTERRSVLAYLEGRLRENTSESEGEHTGYVLEIEVDMSAVQNAEELVNEQVAITGEVEFADYPERGKELVFKVTSAAEVEGEVEETE
jgi:hypothetical protein